MAGRTVIGYQVIIYVWVVGRIKGGARLGDGNAVKKRVRKRESKREIRI
jgi:hypothetical protein